LSETVNVDARTGKFYPFSSMNKSLSVSFENLIDLCVEICLPPLTLVGGKCLKLDLGIASDLTKDLGLGSTSDILGGVLGNGNGDALGGILGSTGAADLGGLVGGGGGGGSPLGGLGLL
jgi:hypothetical protein